MQKKLFNRNYCLLLAVNLITALGFSMIASIVSSYAITLGAGLTLAGTLAGAFSISALIIRPFSGMAMDAMNKRNICIFSTLLICFSFLGYAITPNITVMLVFRVLHGMAFGISGTANMALVSEFIPKERLGEGLGYFGMGQIIAQICGPNIGIAIKNQYGYQALFIGISIFTVIAVLLLLFIQQSKTENQKQAERRKFIFRLDNLVVKEAIMFALTAGLFSLGNGIVNSFLVLLGEERGISDIGLFFSVNAAILFAVRILTGKLIDKSSLTIIVNLSLFVTAVSMLLIGSSSGIVLLLAAAVFKALGQGGGQIALQSACIKKVDAKKVGIATSTYYIGADIGQGFGPILGGKISALFDYRTMFFFMAALMIVGVVAFTIYQIRSRKKEVSTTATECV